MPVLSVAKKTTCIRIWRCSVFCAKSTEIDEANNYVCSTVLAHVLCSPTASGVNRFRAQEIVSCTILAFANVACIAFVSSLGRR